MRLHRCSGTLITGPHPCWQVQLALDEAGVDYEVVKHPILRARRMENLARTGQKVLPAIELENGTMIREQSKQLVARVRDGRLTASPRA